LEVDTTAALASEIEAISKKVTMSTENTDMSEDDEAAEPMDVEEDAVYMPSGMTRTWKSVAPTTPYPKASTF
jgi:hypothetical protein